jgi:cell wall assembly regulator SMI1
MADLIEYDKIFEEYNGETATDAAIAKTEKDVKKTLPASYKKLMQIQNGGYINRDRNCHRTPSATSWAGNHICIGMCA